MNFDITDPVFTDKHKACEHLESIRWFDGPVCPHCGSDDARALKGKSHRPGLYQCNGCREQFTVTVATVFESTKVRLNKWILAAYLMAASKKGMSAHQLHRMIGVTHKKVAWFMCHRIREGMRDNDDPPLGESGKGITGGDNVKQTDSLRGFQ